METKMKSACITLPLCLSFIDHCMASWDMLFAISEVANDLMKSLGG